MSATHYDDRPIQSRSSHDDETAMGHSKPRSRTLSSTDKGVPSALQTSSNKPDLLSSAHDTTEFAYRSSIDTRASSQSARPTTRDLNKAYERNSKVKLGPRPSMEAQSRIDGSDASEGHFRPKATLPAGLRMPTRKPLSSPPKVKAVQRPLEKPASFPSYQRPSTAGSQSSTLTSGTSQTLLLPNNESKAPKMTPEKRRLMKALQIRQRHMEAQNAANGLGITMDKTETSPKETRPAEEASDIHDSSDLHKEPSPTSAKAARMAGELPSDTVDSPNSMPENSDGPSTKASSVHDEEVMQKQKQSALGTVSQELGFQHGEAHDVPRTEVNIAPLSQHESSSVEAEQQRDIIPELQYVDSASFAIIPDAGLRTANAGGGNISGGLKTSRKTPGSQSQALQTDRAIFDESYLAHGSQHESEKPNTVKSEAYEANVAPGQPIVPSPSADSDSPSNLDALMNESQKLHPATLGEQEAPSVVTVADHGLSAGSPSHQSVEASQVQSHEFSSPPEPAPDLHNMKQPFAASHFQIPVPQNESCEVMQGDKVAGSLVSGALDEDKAATERSQPVPVERYDTEDLTVEGSTNSEQAPLSNREPLQVTTAQTAEIVLPLPSEALQQADDTTHLAGLYQETFKAEPSQLQQSQDRLLKQDVAAGIKRPSTPDQNDEQFLSDDSFMEELKSANIQEAKPISVSKSPMKPVYPRSDGDTRPIAGHSSRSFSNPSGGNVSTDTSSPPRPPPLMLRSFSAVSPSKSTLTPSPVLPVPQAKKTGVSSGISQRIKALEKLSSRPGSPASSSSGTPTFLNFPKASFRSTNGITDLNSPSLPSQSSSVYPSPSPSPNSPNQDPFNRLPKSPADSFSITATIIQDRGSPAGPPVDNLRIQNLEQQHHASATKENGSVPSQKQQAMKPPPRSPLRPPRPKYSRYSSARSVSSSSTERKGDASQATRRSSFASKRSLSSRNGSDLDLPRMTNDRSGSASPLDGINEEKRRSKGSRFLKRMSSAASISRRSIAQAISPSPRAESIIEHHEPIPDPAPVTSIDVGDINVQFPDTLV